MFAIKPYLVMSYKLCGRSRIKGLKATHFYTEIGYDGKELRISIHDIVLLGEFPFGFGVHAS